MASKVDDDIFKKKEYESGDGMMTMIWGPIFWNTLHMVSFNYPVCPSKQQQEDYCKFLLYMGKVLPCSYCRTSFPSNLMQAGYGPDVFTSRDAFSRFIFKLHEIVNFRITHKPSGLSFEDVRSRFENFRSRCLTQREHSDATKKEGCTAPLHADTKGRCVIKIVPVDSSDVSFDVSPACQVRREL